MRILYPDGSSIEAMILNLTGRVLRVAVPGGEDVLEFKLVNGIWLSEQSEGVTFDFPFGGFGHKEFDTALREVLRPARSLPGYPEDWFRERAN
jgi:hypothetical protein